ncbi:MAG: hypothetical protein AAGA03_15605, partial [Planctomycetota bacterium]
MINLRSLFGDSGCERARILIEKDVQLCLLTRFAAHFAAVMLYFAIISIFAFAADTNEDAPFEFLLRFVDEAVFWLPGLLLLLPLTAYDLLWASHRFAGPVFRLRREMLRLADGAETDPLLLREDDQWTDLVTPYNRLRKELLELRELKASGGIASSRDELDEDEPATEAELDELLGAPGDDDSNSTDESNLDESNPDEISTDEDLSSTEDESESIDSAKSPPAPVDAVAEDDAANETNAAEETDDGDMSQEELNGLFERMAASKTGLQPA